MRSEAPVMWHAEPLRRPRFLGGDPRHADVHAGQWRSDDLLVAARRHPDGHGPARSRHALLFRASMDTMINLDAPHHLQLRREHMPYFTPSYLRGLTERVKGRGHPAAGRHGAAAGGRGDHRHGRALLSVLPLFTLCEILGVPPEDRGKFLKWMHYLERAQDLAVQQAAAPITPTLELMQFVQDFNTNVEEMFDYGRMMLLKRREDPQNDLMTAIARAQVDGALLADEYLDGSWLLIVFAGNDTTRNTLSGAMKLLTEFPDQKQLLIDDPVADGRGGRRVHPHGQPGDLHAPHGHGRRRARTAS
jgi:cytochrome P450